MKKQIEYILARLADAKEAGELPNALNLTTYATDADLNYFRPNEGWANADEHKDAMIDIANAVQQNYPEVSVNLVEIDRAGFDKWRKQYGYSNEEQYRAMYATTITNK